MESLAIAAGGTSGESVVYRGVMPSEAPAAARSDQAAGGLVVFLERGLMAERPGRGRGRDTPEPNGLRAILGR